MIILNRAETIERRPDGSYDAPIVDATRWIHAQTIAIFH